MAWMAHRGPPEAVAKSNSPKNDLHLVLVGDDSEWRSLHLVWAHGTSHRPVPHYPPVGGYSATARIGTTMGHPGHPRGHNAPPRPLQGPRPRATMRHRCQPGGCKPSRGYLRGFPRTVGGSVRP